MAVTEVSAENSQLIHVAPDGVAENALNPRRGVGDIDELAASIRQFGVLEPLLAFERDREDGTLGTELVLLAGHRRRAAALAAHASTVPVLVRPEPPAPEQLMMMLIENGHRNDLAPIEEARSYAALVDLGVKQKDIATRCGRSDGHVSKRLAIVQKLPVKVLDRFDRGDLSIEAAYALSRIADDSDLVERLAGQRGLDEKWLLRDVERELARRVDAKAEKKAVADLDAAGHRVMDIAQIANGTCRVLVGNEASLRDDNRTHSQVWLALTIGEHAAEGCHAAVVTCKGGVVWVCRDAGAHPDVATVRRYAHNDPPTVDEINSIAARNNDGGYVEPPPSAELVALFEAVRDRAVERRAALAKWLSGPLTDQWPLTTWMLGVADVGDTDIWDIRDLDLPPRVVCALLGLADVDDTDAALVGAAAEDAAAFTLACAIAVFETAIFSIAVDAEPKASWTSAYWSHELPGDWGPGYFEWLDAIGVGTGDVEAAWLDEWSIADDAADVE